jgi:transposase
VLEYTASKFYVRQIVRSKYILKNTETIVISELPTLPIPKGNAGSSLLVNIAVSKFVDHLPFYRLRQIFKRDNLDIKPSSIGGWFSKNS